MENVPRVRMTVRSVSRLGFVLPVRKSLCQHRQPLEHPCVFLAPPTVSLVYNPQQTANPAKTAIP